MPVSSVPTPANEGVDKSAVQLGELAARLRLSTTRLARRLRTESDTGLSPSLLSALSAVQVHGPLTLGELAEHEGVAPPTITKVVGHLERSALVVRTTDDEDRRICRVETTDAGDELLTASREQKTAWLAGRLAAITDERRSHLLDAVELLEELVAGESS